MNALLALALILRRLKKSSARVSYKKLVLADESKAAQ